MFLPDYRPYEPLVRKNLNIFNIHQSWEATFNISCVSTDFCLACFSGFIIKPIPITLAKGVGTTADDEMLVSGLPSDLTL